MAKKSLKADLQNLPAPAAEFIKLVINKMRYRRKVRADVMAELAAHFEDELRICATDEEKEQKGQRLIADFGDAKLLGVLLRRAKKRCRPLWRTVVARTFQTFCVFIACLVMYLIWFFSGKPNITVDYVAELNRMVRPASDESLNAAPFYNKAVQLYEEKSSDEIPELLGTKYNEATTKQKKTIEKWLNDNKEIFDLVIAGTGKPYYWQEYKESEGREGEGVVSVIMPNLAEFLKITYALRWRAWLSAENGLYEDAFNDVTICYRLGQHLSGDLTLVEQLVGLALETLSLRTLREILSEHQVDSTTLATLQSDFERIVADKDFVISIKTEKLLAYDEIQRCFTEDRFGGGHLYLPRIAGLGGPDVFEWDEQLVELLSSPEDWLGATKALFMHPNKLETREVAERYYAWAETIINKSPAQLRAQGIDVEKENMGLTKDNILMEILSPAIGKINKRSHRTKAEVEATLAIVALLRFKLDTGGYPENLDKLVQAGYLKELPIDPFSDELLIYKKVDSNFLLYSVGPNFADDAGESEMGDKGTPKPGGEHGDVVFWPVSK